MRLLSVDFDFFTPNLLGSGQRGQFVYDWGHREAPFFLGPIWQFRAQAFFASGLSLPDTTGEEVGFWDRFRLSEDAVLYYADSHSQAASWPVLRGVTEVDNFDAHHDAGYTRDAMDAICQSGMVDCGNWMLACRLRDIACRVHYPAWKTWWRSVEPPPNHGIRRTLDQGQRFPKSYQRVFLCRSGAWTPPWNEEAFWSLVKRCPVATKVPLETIEKREWSVAHTLAAKEAAALFATARRSPAA